MTASSTEQLAGDEIEGSNAETQIATTFLRLGTWDDEPADPKVDRYDQLDDVLGTTATAFLGLTLRCARCHDHKFEPFPQADYYRMLAVFEPLKRPQKDRADLDMAVGTCRSWRDSAAAAPGAAGLHLDRRGGQAAGHPRPPPRRPRTSRAKKSARGCRPFWSAISPTRPGQRRHTSGRRLWLAHWLASADNPLTARVIVNRVWQGHFGRGLVASANDFGTAGEPPTHPELLDWLATEFIAGGWRLKPLHRLIVPVQRLPGVGRRRRPNRCTLTRGTTLLGRWRQRRLEAEAVRDSVLAVSGRLNPQQRGPSMYPDAGAGRPGRAVAPRRRLGQVGRAPAGATQRLHLRQARRWRCRSWSCSTPRTPRRAARRGRFRPRRRRR